MGTLFFFARIVQDLDVDRRPCRSKGDPRGMRIELSGRKGKGSDAYRVDIVLDWIDIGIRSISLHERQHFGLLMVSIQHSPYVLGQHARHSARVVW